MKRRIFVLLGLAVLLTATMGAAAAVASAQNTQSTNPGGSTTAAANRITVVLKPVGSSGVHGSVDLTQLSGSGTHIALTAKGLKPKHKYLSLYYGNHRCDLEPYSKDDVIGRYSANHKGIGRTSSDVKDNLDEINSVSVRTASFELQACADVHP